MFVVVLLVLLCHAWYDLYHQEHLRNTCEGVRVACSAGCGVQLLRKEVSPTFQVLITQCDFVYYSCQVI